MSAARKRRPDDYRQADRDFYYRHQRSRDREEDYSDEDSSRKQRGGSYKRSTSSERRRSRADNSGDEDHYDDDFPDLKGWKELDSCGYSSRRCSRNHSSDRYEYDSDDSLDSTGRSSYRGGDPSKELPNNTIMVRGLPPHVTENDLRINVIQHGLMPKDIRLIRNKETGVSRGFAFLEFNLVEEAVTLMEEKQGLLVIPDQCKATLHYSIQKDSRPADSSAYQNWSKDWFCVKCCTLNFKRRNVCFKCSASREESTKGTDSSEVCFHPTRTILIRNLNTSSTEDSVLLAITCVSALPIRSIRIGRDPTTNMSQGVCYIDMNNIVDAKQLYSALTRASPIIDGKEVLISYCKIPTSSNSSAGGDSGKSSATAAATHSQIDLSQYTVKDVPRLANYSASLYATTPEEHSSYLQYYTQYYETELKKNGGSKESSSDTNTPDTQQQKSSAEEQKPAVVPDVSMYTYDESSGYYYDSSSGLYYDPNTQYYYNGQTGQFLYWNAETSSLIPVEDKTTPKEDEKKNTKEKEKQEKVKVAKKIVKEMELWAKNLNKKKDSARSNVAASAVSEVSTPSFSASKLGGSADVGFALLDRMESSLPNPPRCLLASTTPPSSTVTSQGMSLVSTYGGGSDSEEELTGTGDDAAQQEEDEHTDWDKLICLLCKRQFPNKDVLIKHQKLSELHKSNFNAWYRARGLDPEDHKLHNKKYRDRAKERRTKFGDASPPHPNHLKEKYLKVKSEVQSASFDKPSERGIGADNVGSKLLQKMGWQDGMGLGKKNQGRTSIIETESRPANVGLGHKSSSYQKLPGDTYKDCAKKILYARYQEILDRESNS